MTHTINENVQINDRVDITGNLDVNSKFSVNASSGNVSFDGTLTTANVTRYIHVTPAAMMLDTSANEDPDEANSGNAPVLTFNDTEKNIVYFGFRVPEDWKSGTDINIEVIWTSATTSGNVEWEIDYTAVPTDGTEATASDGTDAYIDAAPGTASYVLTTGSNLTVPSGSLAAGDMVFIQLFRDAQAGNGDDTLAGTALLLGANIEYTATR